MTSYIIGIAGKRNAGKDTVTSMINYIFNKGVANAKFTEWYLMRVHSDVKNKDKIFHFADPLKDIVSIAFNIERYLLDDRHYKDELWYCLESGNFYTDVAVKKNDYFAITADYITEHKYSIAGAVKCLFPNKFHVIKLRTILQYVGTDLFRNKINEDIWIKCGTSKITDIAYSKGICIVPDVRFANEAKVFKRKDKSLYGVLIKVERESSVNDEHSSEQINFDADYTIENFGNLTNLFYSVLSVIQQIYRLSNI